jgi:DNA-binding NarL/FixJ family response regulator
MRCLVVDDDDSPRELILRVVRGLGHRVSGAPDMAAAREFLSSEEVDVVLLDLEMPGTHGAEAIAMIREMSPEARILVVSGHDDPRHVIAALEGGADGYLLKDELGEALRDALQAVRAGHAPLSPRVAAVMLRRLREKPPPPPTTTTKLARIR